MTTFAEQMVSDVDNILINSSEFAEAITYHPYGSTNISAYGVFNLGEDGASEDEDREGIKSTATLAISTTDVASVNVAQDEVTARSIRWLVTKILEQSNGLVMVQIESYETLAARGAMVTKRR